MSKVLGSFLQKMGIEPVIVDVGSSGYAQFDFSDIAHVSKVIGFDADPRGQDLKFAEGFHSHHLVKKIVVSSDEQTEAEFRITKFPACSSLLDPDLTHLNEFSFKEYFEVDKIVKLQATSLNRVQEQLNIPGFDWLKIDAQGADLQMVKSLSPKLLENVLVLEMEPGLIDAYKGEDLFGATHEFLWKNNFWPSQLSCQQYPRINTQLKKDLMGSLPESQIDSFSMAPTCAEVRYHRTLTYYRASDVPYRNLVLGFVFALVDKQVGHALEIAKIASQKNSAVSFEDFKEIAIRFVKSKNVIGQNTLSQTSLVRRAVRKAKRISTRIMGTVGGRH